MTVAVSVTGDRQMNLKDRLARLDRSLQKVRPDEKSADKHGGDSRTFQEGRTVETTGGVFWQMEEQFDLDYSYGGYPIAGLFSLRPQLLVYLAKDTELSEVQLEKLIFLDTETTGLSGGIGTFAFLIGLGYFDNDRFVVRQYFMRSFHEERPMLTALMEFLESRMQHGAALVSFNGKSYDIPLLLNRCVFHRLIYSTPSWPHVDLLHAARRFWKHAMPDCSLTTIENQVLGIRRNGDLPSHLIPERFFRFLRTGDWQSMEPVFLHNRWDILTLAALLQGMLYILEGKRTGHVPINWAALGAVCEKLGDFEMGEIMYSYTLRHARTPQEKKQGLLRLARLHKKRGQLEYATRLWEEALSIGGFSVEPYEELAKAFEHRIRDLQRAREYTVRALENVKLLERLRDSHQFREERLRLEHRLRRIERKLGARKSSRSDGK